MARASASGEGMARASVSWSKFAGDGAWRGPPRRARAWRGPPRRGRNSPGPSRRGRSSSGLRVRCRSSPGMGRGTRKFVGPLELSPEEEEWNENGNEERERKLGVWGWGWGVGPISVGKMKFGKQLSAVSRMFCLNTCFRKNFGSRLFQVLTTKRSFWGE
ncbi:ABC transporter I family member 1 [Iris pallida]|uniref:ABC transporter I family member 1 n=1 Tax=Iris pallida TaxID=29817 RepID=A0AAX6FPQ0_IRIPA|nr:ABC transporter I family member 1 [Iris pallida]